MKTKNGYWFVYVVWCAVSLVAITVDYIVTTSIRHQWLWFLLAWAIWMASGYVITKLNLRKNAFVMFLMIAWVSLFCTFWWYTLLVSAVMAIVWHYLKKHEPLFML